MRLRATVSLGVSRYAHFHQVPIYIRYDNFGCEFPQSFSLRLSKLLHVLLPVDIELSSCGCFRLLLALFLGRVRRKDALGRWEVSPPHWRATAFRVITTQSPRAFPPSASGAHRPVPIQRRATNVQPPTFKLLCPHCLLLQTAFLALRGCFEATILPRPGHFHLQSMYNTVQTRSLAHP